MVVVEEYSRRCCMDVLCSLGGTLFDVVCFVGKSVVVQYVDEVCVCGCRCSDALVDKDVEYCLEARWK